MDENSVDNYNKLLWDLITPKEIKDALRDENQHKKFYRRSSICTELPLRTIYAKSSLGNYFIREHYFQNPLKKYYGSVNLTLSDDKNEKVQSANNLWDVLNLEMEHLNLENCEPNHNFSSKSPSDLSLTLSDDSLENGILNKGLYECEDHSQYCEKDGEEFTKLEGKEFNDTLDEINILLGSHKCFSPTRKSGLITCSSLNLLEVSPVKYKNWIHSEPVSAIKSILPCKSKESSNEIERPACKNTGKSSSLRNIRSPVGVYIKNPSTMPPIRHVTVNPLIKKKLFQKSSNKVKSNKENVDFNLPLRVYKPAQHKIFSKQSTVKLPSNIQKRIPTTPKVIKHSSRITKRKICGASLEIELLKENLTNICDTSALNSTSSSAQEISVLSTKEEYIK